MGNAYTVQVGNITEWQCKPARDEHVGHDGKIPHIFPVTNEKYYEFSYITLNLRERYTAALSKCESDSKSKHRSRKEPIRQFKETCTNDQLDQLRSKGRRLLSNMLLNGYTPNVSHEDPQCHDRFTFVFPPFVNDDRLKVLAFSGICLNDPWRITDSQEIWYQLDLRPEDAFVRYAELPTVRFRPKQDWAF